VRRFIDLRVAPGKGRLDEFVARARELGYSGLGVTGHPVGPQPQGVDLVTRLDLAPANQQQLVDQLNRHRRGFTVLAVSCATKAVARQAAKDHRVDILRFPRGDGSPAWMDRQQAQLAAGSHCLYEVDAQELMIQDPARLEVALALIRRELGNARGHGVPVVLSSGARSPQEMRDPRSMASLMDLVGVGEEEALGMVSDTPWRLVERNRDKLSGAYLLPGVTRVE
jgi:RNase P/RNase MRP subunit p30